MTDLSVSFCGVHLKNPLVAASGCFGFGREYDEYFNISELGAISVKGLTLKPRAGNPPPRIAETPAGCLNSVGLQNPGVEAFLKKEQPFLRGKDIVIIANISGETVEEYGQMAKLLGGAVDMLEVNISCPNIHAGGRNFGSDPASAAAVTEAVKKHACVPVCVKLSPNVTDIVEIALACKGAGADALSLINTLTGMRIDIESRIPILHRNIGGLSGQAIFPVALRCVWQVAAAAKLPVIGMGGVASGAGALEMMVAGANAVAIGTALFQDAKAHRRILGEMSEWCKGHDVSHISEIVGSVKPH